MYTAEERGELLMFGGVGPLHALPSGIGTYHLIGSFGPNFGKVLDDYDLLTRSLDMCEQAGYGAGTCPSLRALLGSMMVGGFDSSDGKKTKIDFHLETALCQPQAQSAQIVAERHNAPFFLIEIPPTEKQSAFLIMQMNDFIEWLEKVTGRKYDDEKLITAVNNEWEVRVLWSRLCEQQKVVPAPLKLASLYSFMNLMWRSGRHRPETVEFYRLALDEVRHFVEEGIAAVSTERCRLMHEGSLTWYDSIITKYPERWGAVFTGSEMCFGSQGAWEVEENGCWKVAPTIGELGLEMRNRDEALAVLAKLYLQYAPGNQGFALLDRRIRNRTTIAKDWHIDGLVTNNDRACRGACLGNTETVISVKQEGIPAVSYDGACIDPRDFDDIAYKSQIETFLETTLGLTALYD
jgi:benzoyl-CoA reductase subunit B